MVTMTIIKSFNYNDNNYNNDYDHNDYNDYNNSNNNDNHDDNYCSNNENGNSYEWEGNIK